jgi:hypothetical protein
MVSAAITSNRRCRLCDEHWHAKILERNHPCTELESICHNKIQLFELPTMQEHTQAV